MIAIYALVDPRNNHIRYVGKTSAILYKRLSGHYKENKPTHKCRWISILKSIGLKPQIELLETCTEANWREREVYWIALCSRMYHLTNILPGGEGLRVGYKHSLETIEKIRIAAKRPNAGTFTSTKRGDRNKASENCRKPILQYSMCGELIREWPGTKFAAESLGFGKSMLSDCLNGRRKSAYSFIWLKKPITKQAND